MRRQLVPVENAAEIGWGVLLVIYLIGSGRPEYLRWPVLAVFGVSAASALVETFLRRRAWPWLVHYDSVLWTVLLSAMVAVTGGRGSEVWPAYMLMSLTAPSAGSRLLLYGLLAVNSLEYAAIYVSINPYGAPFNLSLLLLRVGLFFLVAWVVERSMAREQAANLKAIDAAQSRVGELVSARDAERRRIAGDIHDWLGSGIVAPVRKLELALRAPDPAAARGRVEEAVESLRRSHEELRRLMENLHPHLLEQMGLPAALRAYVAQWGAEQGVATEFRCDEAPEPPAEVALAAYRILQEALNNAAKHADAVRVAVRLSLRADAVLLTVVDDGRGFAVPAPGGRRVDAARESGGRGLTGMAERAALFGGAVSVTSSPGGGTAVAADLPWAGRS